MDGPADFQFQRRNAVGPLKRQEYHYQTPHALLARSSCICSNWEDVFQELKLPDPFLETGLHRSNTALEIRSRFGDRFDSAVSQTAELPREQIAAEMVEGQIVLQTPPTHLLPFLSNVSVHQIRPTQRAFTTSTTFPLSVN